MWQLSLGFVANDVKDGLQNFFAWGVCHLRHTANMRAYRLTKLTLFSDFTLCWFEEPLNLIHDIILEDYMPKCLSFSSKISIIAPQKNHVTTFFLFFFV